MIYTIKYMPRSVKQLSQLPQQVRVTIVNAIAQLADRDQWNNVKRLTNHKYQYRLRVGNYRVFFDTEESIVTIYICEIKKRDGNTYK